ncbi:MAG: ABC transporter permease [Actinomycetota bacterium]
MNALLLAQFADMSLDWEWLFEHSSEIQSYLLQHILLTATAVGLGFVLALPMSLASSRWPHLYTPLLNFTGVLFTIPSLALFVLLIPFTGLGPDTALIGLTIYTLLILLRNTVEGLRGVPQEVRESAQAMGYSRRRQLFLVELPLAIPVIIAGLRIATVTTIGLITITVLIGQPSLGRLFADGFALLFATPIYAALVLSVVLAVTADLLLVGFQRLVTPWTRDRR